MSDISRWDLRSGRVGDNNEVFFMDRSKDGPWVSYGDAVFALDAKDALLREAAEVLKRSGAFALDQNALTLGLAIGTILFKIDEAQK